MAVNVKMGVDLSGFTAGIREGQGILKGLNAEMKATEAEFKENGFSEIFGNFKGSTIANWQERANRGNVQGAEVSTWCLPNEDENGRNGWFYELAFSSAVLWRSDYSDECRTAWNKSAEKLLPELKSLYRDAAEGRFEIEEGIVTGFTGSPEEKK